MRLLILFAAIFLSLTGCISSHRSGSQPATGVWRVVPLNTNSPDRPAILVNEETGDTWMYTSGSWNPIQRR